MAAPSRVYTIDRVAIILGVDIEILDELASTMTPEDGVLWIVDASEDGCIGFTPFGLENATEQLSDPEILDDIKSRLAKS